MLRQVLVSRRWSQYVRLARDVSASVSSTRTGHCSHAAHSSVGSMTDFAASAVPLTGGYGGQTFAVSAGGEDAVLKFYVKDPERAVVDAALLQLVRGLLPVPRVLDRSGRGRTTTRRTC